MRRIAVSLAVLALAAAGAYWWSKNFRRVVVLDLRTPRAVAADPWLPARRILAARGASVRDEPTLTAILERVRPDDVLILAKIEGELSRENARRIGAWVRSGGRLVVSVEPFAADGNRDSLLAGLGVSVAGEEDEEDDCPGAEVDGEDVVGQDAFGDDDGPGDYRAGALDGEAGEDGAGREAEQAAEADACADAAGGGTDDGAAIADGGADESGGRGEAAERETDADVAARGAEGDAGIGGNGEPSADSVGPDATTDGEDSSLAHAGLPVQRVTLPDGTVLETDDYEFGKLVWTRPDRPADWVDTSGRLLLARVGRGAIAVVHNGGVFRGKAIRERDHAELLVRLAIPDGKRHVVWIARYGSLPSWYGWLWEHAWPALLSLLLLALLGMRRAAARFGPVEPAEGAARANLLEHAAAAGRWLWSLPEGPDILATRLRTSALAAVRARRPELAGLDAAALARALAAEGRASERDIVRALDTVSPGDPAGFLKTARTLWIIRRTK